jgi:uncharacterized protein (DUF2267 family)
MARDYDEFIAMVERGAGISRGEAERAVHATLQTLAERLSRGEARDIANQLPEDVRPWLTDGGKVQPFDLEEFLRRVAGREGVSVPQAEEHVRTVFGALGSTVGADELEDVASELPTSFNELLDTARRQAPAGVREREGIRAAEFAESVARKANLNRSEAARATRAVLETLGERISAGQARDLAAVLPTQLRQPLERGNAASNGVARPLSLDEFVARVAEREGVPAQQAREQARAVLATLRESVGGKEFQDTVAQLPRDYTAILPRP